MYWLITDHSGNSEDEVLRQLAAEEEAARTAAGTAALHNTSPFTYLTLGLELEESQ